MKRIIFIILLIGLTYSCDNHTETVPHVDVEPSELNMELPPFRDLRDFPEIANQENIDSLILGMIDGNCVYESAVGIGGSYTKEYACFERLCELQNEEELLKLTKHKNANVRLYGFKALEKVRSTHLEKAVTNLKEDTARVCIFSGCTKLTMPLKDVISFVSNY